MPKKISRLNISIPARIPAITVYLFLLKYPVSITHKPNMTESRDAYTILYSISKILKLGPQTELIQKV